MLSWARCLHCSCFFAFLVCQFHKRLFVFIYGFLSSTWPVHLSFHFLTVHCPSHSTIWVVSPGLLAVVVSQAPVQDISVIDPKGELEFSPLRLKGTPVLAVLHKICQPGNQMTWHFHLQTGGLVLEVRRSVAGHSQSALNRPGSSSRLQGNIPILKFLREREQVWAATEHHSACSWRKQIHPSLYHRQEGCLTSNCIFEENN